MLVLLPPSEGKSPARRRGNPVAIDALSFPELAAAREEMLDRLVATSALDDAHERLDVGASLRA